MGQCVICDESHANGIYLHKLFICTPCEHNIIHTDAREQKYDYYVHKLKSIQRPTLYS